MCRRRSELDRRLRSLVVRCEIVGVDTTTTLSNPILNRGTVDRASGISDYTTTTLGYPFENRCAIDRRSGERLVLTQGWAALGGTGGGGDGERQLRRIGS